MGHINILVFNIIRVLLYLASTAFIWIFIFKPKWLAPSDSLSMQRQVYRVILFFAWLSLFIILYMGLDKAFSFIPMTVDSEGGTLRGAIVGFLSLVSSIYIMLSVMHFRTSFLKSRKEKS